MGAGIRGRKFLSLPEQIPHLAALEWIPRLDRCLAGRHLHQSVHEVLLAPAPSLGIGVQEELVDEFSDSKTSERVRNRMERDGPFTESLHLESDRPEIRLVIEESLGLGGREVQDLRNQEALHRHSLVSPHAIQDLVVQDPLVERVLIRQREAVFRLTQDVRIVDLDRLGPELDRSG